MNRESSGPEIDSGIVRAGPWPVQPVQKAEAERRSSYKKRFNLCKKRKRSGEAPTKSGAESLSAFLKVLSIFKSFQQNYSQSVGINKKGGRDPQHQTGKVCCLRPLGYRNSTLRLLHIFFCLFLTAWLSVSLSLFLSLFICFATSKQKIQKVQHVRDWLWLRLRQWVSGI